MMKKLTGYEIRAMWLDFWRTKGHDIIESAPLIPINDPTLLWINSGVASLKKYFDGSQIPQNRRLANAQKSIRTNDIDNVGRTARHHTFFEMLGNFSIGDYFRAEALEYAMEILTAPQWFGFALDKLYFTVYPDDEASIEKWVSLGVKREHIFKLEGNYWEIGEGPCGPNTEIFYDRGSKYDPDNLGTELIAKDISNDRYIEIWNIVFSQYNAKAGLARSDYKELPSKNIDTGMGLERMACVIQEVETNYETDLFYPLIMKCSQIVGVPYQGQMAFKVISDHIRSVSFALSDGATFANEGRGYVLRRLLRRAVRFGKVLGMKQAFLYQLVSVVGEIMQDSYPNLQERVATITKQIKLEEEKFLVTLEAGEKRLLDFIKQSRENKINKETAFLLYDTFGFPFELTQELAQEYNFLVDEEGFYNLLNEQKERARQARDNSQSMNIQNEEMIKFKMATKFVGYDTLDTRSKVVAIFKNGLLCPKAKNEILVVFDITPFYAEAGGQVGDVGELLFNNKTYQVNNTIKLPNGEHALYVDMKDDFLSLNDFVQLSVDEELRFSTMRNHSATHLLNEALRKVVGEHVTQQGSFVGPQRFRFDFNHYSLLTFEQILAVEELVNKEIKASHQVVVKQMSLEEAKKQGAQAVFGEKYGNVVRVIDMTFAQELCGGTHVSNTRDIKKMAIISLETKGSGIYRIEGATGDNIIKELNLSLANITKDINLTLEKIAQLEQKAKVLNLKITVTPPEIMEVSPSYKTVLNKRQELESLRIYERNLSKEIETSEKAKASLSLKDYLNQVENINDEKHLVFKLENVSLEVAKDLVDRLSSHLNNSIIFLGLSLNEKVVFICKNKIVRLNAGLLAREASIVAGGNGGGRQDFAQAGGKDLLKLDEALTKAKTLMGG